MIRRHAPRHSQRLPLVAAIVSTLIFFGAISMAAAAQKIAVEAALPADFPDDGFDHDSFERLLTRYVDESGDVDYESWHANDADSGALNAYLAAVSAYSPENAPQRFATRNDELAYWMYAYNAYVIKAILNRWPLESVTDVKARFEIVRGFGFFYSQRFMFGGDWYSLYHVENKKIRARYKDARIHFVLNCGSESCPVLRPELPVGDELEPFLQASTIRFVSERRNVHIDHENRQIVLSDIFKMYRKDFINDLRHRGLPTENGLVDYIVNVAPEPLKDELLQAQDYKVIFSDYDWSINKKNSVN